MSKWTILCCNILPQTPATACSYLCITYRCMCMVTVYSTFCTASISNEHQIILSKINWLSLTFYSTFNSLCNLLSIPEIKDYIINSCVKPELNTCIFKVFLHRQDKWFILVILGKLQCWEIRKSAYMMDKSLNIKFHLKRTVPVFKCEHRTPVQPEIWIKNFLIKEIFNCLIIQILIFSEEQLHYFHTALLA